VAIDTAKDAFIDKLPEQGIEPQTLLDAMSGMKVDCGDVDWKRGRGWSLVYYGGEHHTRLLRDAYGLYFSENGLSPAAFPSLRRMEIDIVAMIRDLLRGDSSIAGTMTSGGTESILLAVKTYRDRARVQRPEITQPEILLPLSAHPAFLKAAQFFGLTATPLPLAADFRTDLGALEASITPNTVCIVASAPCYPHGVVDRIPRMAAIAQRADVGLHVDACLGGFLLPFMRELGETVTDFDFAVPGVTSISADLHKNGYAAKGASAVLYRGEELQQHQFFVSTDWPGGVYASPTMLGTRPGGAIAAAWAAMLAMGRDGYRDMVRTTREVTRDFVRLINETGELQVLGDVDANVVCVGSERRDVFAIADGLESLGWRIDRQVNPDCLHHIVTPNHRQALADYRRDLAAALAASGPGPAVREQSRPSLYGVTANVAAEGNSDSAVRSALARSLRLPDSAQ
jgi:glutamate/tyrosine decarboxylase-like PLP-dependent enzyme